METDDVALSLYEQRVIYALRQARNARTEFTRSPNAESQLWVQRAEAYLDEMMDRPRG